MPIPLKPSFIRSETEEAVDHLIDAARAIHHGGVTTDELMAAFPVALADGHDMFEICLSMASIAAAEMNKRRRSDA